MERISDRILATAGERPDAVALRWRGESVSYAELAQRAARIASALTRRGSTAPVALHSTKSPGAVATMIGCSLAGVPYVPVDPTMPGARRAGILRDCGAQLVVVDTEHPGSAPDLAGAGTPVVAVDELLAGEPATELPGGGAAAGEAFILYTSGSTGQPKGVRTTHDNALTFLRWAHALTGVHAGDVVSCYAPLHFDMHVFDVLGALSVGACVVLIDDESIIFPEAVCRLLQRESVTVGYAVPSAWIALSRTRAIAAGGLPALRLLMYAGEEYPVVHLRALVEQVPQARVLNVYGPVETNAITALEVTSEHLQGDRIPIGWPFGESVVHLLGDDGRRVDAPGVEGELVVSTPTAFAGYVGDDDLTAAAFITLVVDGDQLRCYRTGDYACRDETGVLHFRGRRDGRVKTRGFRVEVGEVETRLLAHGDVESVVVVARPHEDWTNELVAFVVAGVPVTPQELTAWCRDALPPYMLPREVLVVGQLPLTATGKADRVELARRASAASVTS